MARYKKKYRGWVTPAIKKTSKFEEKICEIIEAYTRKEAIEILEEKYPDCRITSVWLINKLTYL